MSSISIWEDASLWRPIIGFNIWRILFLKRKITFNYSRMQDKSCDTYDLANELSLSWKASISSEPMPAFSLLGSSALHSLSSRQTLWQVDLNLASTEEGMMNESNLEASNSLCIFCLHVSRLFSRFYTALWKLKYSLLHAGSVEKGSALQYG